MAPRRSPARNLWRLLEPLVWALSLALVLASLLSSVWAPLTNPHELARTDLVGFHRAAIAWAHGQSPYIQPLDNLNPPLVTWLLFRPLVGVSPLSAYLVWTGLMLVCGLVICALSGVWSKWWTLVFLTVTAEATVLMGQVGPVLGLLMALAWRADRSGRSIMAGTLIGAAVVWKPFVGVILLWWVYRRQWRSVGAAGLMAVGVVALQIAAWGSPLFLEWLAALRVTTAAIVPHASNLSWLGFVTRLHAPMWMWWALEAGTVTALLLIVPGRADDQAWAMLLIGSLLLSPLGWNYYLWMVVPMVLSMWRQLPALKWAAWLLLCVPVPNREGLHATIMAAAQHAGALLLLLSVVRLNRQFRVDPVAQQEQGIFERERIPLRHPRIHGLTARTD